MSGGASERGIASPCVRICKQDRQAGFCVGCGRTVREVFFWFDMSDQERSDALARLPARLNSLKAEAGR